MNINDVAEKAAGDAVSQAEQRPKQLGDLAERTADAKKALLDAMQGIGGAIENWRPTSDKYAAEIRSFSTSTTLELKNLLRAFEDIRKFFLSEQHVEEVKRLAEFVSLCERLNALARSGMLDAVSETILKLELKQSNE